MLLKLSLALISFSLINHSAAQGAYPSLEDYSNERILPAFLRLNSEFPEGSGFLYSSRIVLAVAHGSSFPEMYFGKPNSATSDSTRIRVIKKFDSPKFDAKFGISDFSVYVLERDLANVSPARLMTPEIHRELLENRATIDFHGYGGFEDYCAPGETAPCISREYRTSQVPRVITFQLRTAKELNVKDEDLAWVGNELLLHSGPRRGACPGDSGGALTTKYQGQLIYLGPSPNGLGVHVCGRFAGAQPSGGLWYSTPVYRHLDLIAQAEAFLIEQRKLEDQQIAPVIAKKASNKKSITCVKGKLVKKVTAKRPKCSPGWQKR